MILQSGRGMANSQPALDHRPGVRPDVRMVGGSVVLVMPVFGAPINAHVHLILRVDPDGEVFAALDWRRIERAK
jgi:hypothetical protein